MNRICQSAGDCGAIIAAVGTLAGWLPSIAALFTIIWLGINIYKDIRDWKKGSDKTLL